MSALRTIVCPSKVAPEASTVIFDPSIVALSALTTIICPSIAALEASIVILDRSKVAPKASNVVFDPSIVALSAGYLDGNAPVLVVDHA